MFATVAPVFKVVAKVKFGRTVGQRAAAMRYRHKRP